MSNLTTGKRRISAAQGKFFSAWGRIKSMRKKQAVTDHKISKFLEEKRGRYTDFLVVQEAKKSYQTDAFVSDLKILFSSEYATQLFVRNNGSCGCADEGVCAHNSFLVLKGRKKYVFLDKKEYADVIRAFATLGLKLEVSDNPEDLLPREEYLHTLQRLKDTGRMNELFWHRGCGAAMLDFHRIVRENLKMNSAEAIQKAAEQLLFFPDDTEKCKNFLQEYITKQIKPEQVDLHAENISAALGKYFEVPVKCFEHLKRPVNIHPGKGILISVEPDEFQYVLEPQAVEFPLMYTLSSGITTLKKIPKRMNVLLSIAFGDHGAFGLGMVNEENKFLIAIVIHPSMEAQRYEIVAAIEESLPHRHKKYIRVESFVPYSGKAAEFDTILSQREN